MISFVYEIMENRMERIRKSAKKERTKKRNTCENEENTSLLKAVNALIQIKLFCKKKEFPEFKNKISELEDKMNKVFAVVTNLNFDNIIFLALAYFNLGYIYILTKDVHTAKDSFVRCMGLLKKKELHCKSILTAIHVRLELSQIYHILDQLENSHSLLDEAIEFYLNYTKEEDKYPDPVNIDANFDVELKMDSKIILTKLHITTLEFMQDLYYLKPENKHNFVIYIHNLLNKELTKGITSTDNNEKALILWAKASADLSLYFLSHDRFIEAKHHIAVADYIMSMFYVLHIIDKDYPDFPELLIDYEILLVYINKLWGIYGITLLHSSKERLLQNEDDKSCEANNVKSESLAEEGLVEPLIFVDLKTFLKVPEITDRYVSNFNDAKVVFENVLEWCDLAKTYYIKKNELISHVQIILCISKAYKYFKCFEQNKQKQVNMIKQQIKILEDTLNTLFSKHKTVIEHMWYKKCYLELALTYSTLLHMMFEELDNVEEISVKTKMVMQQIMKKIIGSFNLYIEE